MSNPISSSRNDLEQVYLLHDPALAGHQRAEAVAVGANGITVLASANPKGETEHTWLIRLGDDGALVWEKHYAPIYGTGRAFAGMKRGGFTIAGDVQRGAMAYQASLLTVDAAGAVVSATSVGPRGVTGFYAVQTHSNDAIIAGGTTRWKGWLVSTEATLQHPSEASVEVDEVNGLAVLPSGDVAVLAAVEKSTTGFGLTRLVAVAADGAVHWHNQFPSSGRGDPAALVTATDGGLLALGNGAMSDSAPTHIWMARVDGTGKSVWERTLDGEGTASRARAVAAFPDGTFAVAGETESSSGPRAPHVWRLASDGSVRWTHGYDGSNSEQVTGLAPTRDGGLVMVGSTAHGPGKTNVWVVRLEPTGNVVWQRVFGSPTG